MAAGITAHLAAGRYLGRAVSDVAFLTFPALPVFTAHHVYGVSADSLGVQSVVRARIEKPGSADGSAPRSATQLAPTGRGGE